VTAMGGNIYWGDIHNHNAVGYAKGSLQRSFEIAREHLDFFAHTGHSQWPDMPTMPDDKHMKWVNGFEVMKGQWPRVRQMTDEWYEPGSFATLLGYEFHSSAWGDYHIVYPDTDRDLEYFDDVDALKAHARETGAIIIPHHPAYLRHWRGMFWEHTDTDVSPVAEIFSEHGLAERDRGLHPYIRHSNGGRSTDSTVQWALDLGLKLGIVASTDDHFGYPGGYGEGLTAVLAPELTREAVLDAIRQRRCYAVTGDRIEMGFTLNDQPMGSDLPAADVRQLAVQVSGWDEISMVELIRNGEPVARAFGRQKPVLDPWPGRVRCRVQWGWGPWAALSMPRTCDWDMRLELDGATVGGLMPCYQAGPCEENRRDRVTEQSATACRWQSYTSRKDVLADDPTKSLCFDIEGPADAKLRLTTAEPAERSVERTLGELAVKSANEFTGPFTSESFIVHRLVLPESYEVALEFEDQRPGVASTDYYYVRVTQANGQMAWSSPIWVAPAEESDK